MATKSRYLSQLHEHRHNRSRECSVSGLPEEIVVEIFTRLIPPEEMFKETRHSDGLPIPQVYWRWQHLCDPVLYRRIDLGESPRTVARRSSRLVATLQQRNHLFHNVRSTQVQLWQRAELFELYTEPFSALDMRQRSVTTNYNITEIVTYCKSFQDLILDTTYNPEVRLIMRAIGSRKRLEVLRLLSS